MATLEHAIVALSDGLPDHAVQELLRLARLYTSNDLSGNTVYKDDPHSAAIVDEAVRCILTAPDMEQAFLALRRLPEDVTLRLLTKLVKADGNATKPLLMYLLRSGNDWSDVHDEVLGIISDHYVLTVDEVRLFIGVVPAERMRVLLNSTLQPFIREALTGQYDSSVFASKINELPGQACLEYIDDVDDIEVTETIRGLSPGEVEFYGECFISTIVRFGDEDAADERSMSFPTQFSGSITPYKLVIDDASISVSHVKDCLNEQDIPDDVEPGISA